MYRSILVATDGSELADRGVAHAVGLAQGLGASLLVVTASEPWNTALTDPSGLVGFDAFLEDYRAASTRHASEVLDAVAEQARTRGVQTDPSTLPRGPEKIERDLAMARLAAEIHLRSERYARRPKRKFVSASTQEYAYAAYLRQWVDRVERVGNLNYPDEARRRQLAGELVISVAIRRDGSVERADIIRSSGTPLLDDAALNIARLAEPYPPLPVTDENVDVLHVTRTWNFLPGGTLIDD